MDTNAKPRIHASGREYQKRMGTNCTCLAPAGPEIIAQGFNPGLTAQKRRALKVAPVFGVRLPPADRVLARLSTLDLVPFQQPQPRGRGVQFGQGAVLQNSSTPSLRVAGFEDEDDDEDENEAPCGGKGELSGTVYQRRSVCYMRNWNQHQ